jgi:hypothetical protein
MKKTLLFVVLFTLSYQGFCRIGDNRDFWLISLADFENRIAKGRDVTLRRYIVVPYFDKNHIDVLNKLDENATLAKFAFLLSKNRKKLIERYMKELLNRPENYLIKGLYFFSKKQYTSALSYLELINNKEFDFLKYLLIADCKYEIAIASKNGKPNVEIFQTAMDNSNNHLEKLIINNRVKHLKYN